MSVYDKQTWEGLPAKTTKINAPRLNHMEDGIAAAVRSDTVGQPGGVAGLDLSGQVSSAQLPSTITGARTFTGPVTNQSSNAGGPDTTDTTSRLTVESYQTNGQNFFGEGARLDLKRLYAKNMLAWRLPRPPAGDRLVYLGNPSFDTDTSGWSTFGGAAISVSGLQKLVGNNSGRIDWATGAAGTQGIAQAITGLVVGHTYVAYGWVFVEAGNPAVRLDIDGGGPSAPSTVTDGWQELSTTFVASATSHSMRVVNAAAATSGQRAFTDVLYATSDLGPMRSVVWAGAHYLPQDLSSALHGHYSIETPNAADQLVTRFEILFVDPATGAIGVDKSAVRTANADFVVDCENTQVLRLAATQGAVKVLELGNAKDGSARRWAFRQNNVTEGGGSAGSGLEIVRYADNNTETDIPISVLRSSGRTTIGGAAGTASGLDVRRNAAGTTLGVFNTANGGSGVVEQLADTASVALQASVGAEANPRVKLDMTGKLSFGPGGATAPDTNLYRSAADVLKTDDALSIGGNVGFYNTTPAAKPTVSGSRGGNAALASLLTALAGLGLITDSTTA